MRDPMTWSIPLFRAFGIQVKLHILYIVIALAMLIRAYAYDRSRIAEFALIWIVLLFVIVLLHEFGHCFAARKVDGEAEEILMWPLGGLAFVSVPHTPKANFVATAGGPLVNVLICLVAGAAIASAGFLPPVNVLDSDQLYYPMLRNWHTWEDGKPYETINEFVDSAGKRYAPRQVEHPEGDLYYAKNSEGKPVRVAPLPGDTYSVWVLWTARAFWLSWMLLLFNLIPAFPLDGGRLLQELLWARSGDYRSATQVACWCGLVVALVFVVLSFGTSDPLLLGLALFMMFASYQQLMMLNQDAGEGGAFGYDFSKGYGGFGPDEDAPVVKPKRVGPIKRWLQARRARKLKLEVEQRAADEARLDELLDKIGRLGKESLTAEERRFMDRVSARYRNRP